MKTFDSSVKLSMIDFDLESISHKKQILSNQQILDRRWKNTDRTLRKALPLIRKVFAGLADDAISIMKEIDFTYDRLNGPVTRRIRRIVNARIEEWREQGILSGYLEYLARTHKWTYGSVLHLLIAGLYAERFRKIKLISNDVFVIAAIDAYEQSVADRETDVFPLLTMASILSFSLMPVIGNTYVEYLDSLMISMIDEMDSIILSSTMMNIEITDSRINILIQKQLNRILVINNGKYSGGLDDAARAVSNQAYKHGTQDDKDLQARFIAEMDEKTTKMCRSLDNQLFYVNRMNHFTRFSAQRNGIVSCECEGLVAGLNLPPISDHFHWCRSTITYQINEIGTGVRGATFVEKNGKKYRVDGDKLIFSPSDDEIAFAYWYGKNRGYDVVLNPRSVKINGLRLSDYLFDGKEYDLKTIHGNGKRTIQNALKSSYGQSENFIINISKDSKITNDEAIKQIIKIKNEKAWIKRVDLFNDFKYVDQFK